MNLLYKRKINAKRVADGHPTLEKNMAKELNSVRMKTVTKSLDDLAFS
jgi:hypothetical protein